VVSRAAVGLRVVIGGVAVLFACTAATGCGSRSPVDGGASIDGGRDSGTGDSVDAGRDAGLDAGVDGGQLPDAGPPQCPAQPTDGVWATFRIPSPQPSRPPSFFRALFSSPAGIASALDYWQRRAYPSVPFGVLVCTAVPWNCGEIWHQDPASTVINDFATEICDGSLAGADVAVCEFFRASSYGAFCPFAAELVELRDCRAEPHCPVVPR
jgi:hypothetical protein